jgi:hypothetical protein
MKDEAQGKSLGQFLIDLARYPALAEAFATDFDAAVDKATELSEEDREILRSKDLEQVKAAIAKEYPGETVIFIIWGIW